jgi:hypothetical protein
VWGRDDEVVYARREVAMLVSLMENRRHVSRQRIYDDGWDDDTGYPLEQSKP